MHENICVSFFQVEHLGQKMNYIVSARKAGEGPSNISSTVRVSAFFNMHSRTATYPNQESQKVNACRIKTENCIGGSHFSRAGCCFSEI